MTIPVNPSSDPTDKSMCRQTITRTIPVAIIPTTLDCTAKLYMFLAVKKIPSVIIFSITHITSRAMTMASIRLSISTSRRNRENALSSAVACCAWLGIRILNSYLGAFCVKNGAKRHPQIAKLFTLIPALTNQVLHHNLQNSPFPVR